MNGSIELIADASFGVKVKPGDHVEQGQQLAAKCGSQEPLTSPTAGTVQDVTFDSDGHRFIITIMI